MLSFIAFLHLLLVVTLIGFYVASFIYLAINIQQGVVNVIRKALYASLIADIIILLMVIGLFLTGMLLAFLHHLSFSAPWIIVAYHIVALIGCCWLILFLMKLKNYHSNLSAPFRFKKLFYCLNISIFILLFFAVHDAVMHSTWFYFLEK